MEEKVTLESGEVVSKEFYEKLKSITDKRPRMVIDKLMKDGFCTTAELIGMGYSHGPRAKRDVLEQGIPVERKMVKNEENGSRMARYTLGDWEEYKKHSALSKISGRKALTKKLKKKLIKENGMKCAIYNEECPESQLQIDHRIPFEIGGDPNDMMDTSKFMLLSPSANRAKSWACEHCGNWTQKKVSMCQTCYYAYPKSYEHVAGKKEKRLDLVFSGDEVNIYEKITEFAEKREITEQQAAKRLLEYSYKISGK